MSSGKISGKISRPTLEEIAAEFPEALEQFDWSCPSIAASGRAEFLVRRKQVMVWPRNRQAEVRTQLIAQAPATFDEVPSPVVPGPGLLSSRRLGDLRKWWYGTAGGYTCTPGRELRAYWDSTTMVWRRLTWVQPGLDWIVNDIRIGNR